MRQVVLDTETTGLEPAAGHRVIEIGCVELVNRRLTKQHFHRYVNPERTVEPGALAVHGIEDDFLERQPVFADVARDFIEFVAGAELVIHNAEFDVGFINHELTRVDGVPDDIRECCRVLDTLALARRMHPGQRNSLDALAKRYNVDNSMRELHGALLDAEILAGVYLHMTGGQVALSLEAEPAGDGATEIAMPRVNRDGLTLAVPLASAAELAAHEEMLARLREQAGGRLLWDALAEASRPERDDVSGYARAAEPAELD